MTTYQTPPPVEQTPLTAYSNESAAYDLDYDSVITADAEEKVILPDGEYNFQVRGFERTTSKTNKKMVKLELVVWPDELMAMQPPTVNDYLVLTSSNEWKLSSFFTSLGMKRKGEPLRMDWNATIGAKGRLRLFVESDPKYGESNKIDRYIISKEPEPGQVQMQMPGQVQQAPQAIPQAQAQPAPAATYQAGQF